MTGDQNNLLLTEILHGAQAGLQAAQKVLEQAVTPGLRRELQNQSQQFKEIAEQASHSLAEPSPANAAGAQAWEAVQSGDLAGLSESRMAELLINGSSMGIIELTKKLGDYADAEPVTKGLCKRLINSEEIQIDRMKGYL